MVFHYKPCNKLLIPKKINVTLIIGICSVVPEIIAVMMHMRTKLFLFLLSIFLDFIFLFF